MFSMTTWSKAPIAGTIKVKKRISGLGRIKDVEGKYWDIHAIIRDYVCAVPLEELHPFYTDTSGSTFGFVSQSWKPYLVEVI